MKFPALALLASLLFPVSAISQETGDNNIDRSESRKTVDGFSAMILITSDKDWQEKWATPEQTSPHFTSADSVSVGESISILSFFINPTPDKDGIVHVRCDIKMTKPGGKTGTDLKNQLCFPPTALPKPRNVQMTNFAVVFQAEDSDPKGVWTVELTVHDVVGHHDVPLKTRFTVK